MNERDELYDLLFKIQLEGFHLILRDQLQISRLAHFKHVKPKDLERVGMAKPAIRRLLDAVEAYSKKGPVRPPPPPPYSIEKSFSNHIIDGQSATAPTLLDKVFFTDFYLVTF
jgi:hypothetical protein